MPTLIHDRIVTTTLIGLNNALAGLAKLCKIGSSAEELADRILYEMQGIEEQWQRELAVEPSPTAAAAAPPPPRAPMGNMLPAEWMTEVGVPQIDASEATARFVVVKNVSLRPLSGMLLKVLIKAARERKSGWISLEELAAKLREESGREHSRHGLTNLVYRLREELGGQGIDERLIETSRTEGVRALVGTQPRTPDEPGADVYEAEEGSEMIC